MQITGPIGTHFLLPDDPNATLLMMATGSGIAPFRSFLGRMFKETNSDYKFNGFAWLIFGIPPTSNILYFDELEHLQSLYSSNFRLDYAISREQQNSHGGKLYIQDRIAQQADVLWRLLQQSNTYTYICGQRGTEGGINETLSAVTARSGVDWAEYQKKLKQAGRWRVETY